MAESFNIKCSKGYTDNIRLLPDDRPVHLTPHLFTSALIPTALSGKGVKVCVIDTGVIDHRSMKISTSMANMGRSKHSRDVDGHAHAVAGIIGASDLHHLVGLAPDATVACVKATDDSGAATEDSIAASLLWAVVAGMDIIVISHALNFQSKLIAISLEKAASCHAVIVTNQGVGDVPEYVIQAPSMPLKKPENIPTLAPDGKYTIVSAVDFSAAIVAGLAAIIMEKGHILAEGQKRGTVVKQHLLSVLSKPAK